MSAKYDAGAEVKDIFKLAFAMFFTRVAWTAMKVTDTALIGHSKVGYPQGALASQATALSDLWTDSTGVLLSGGVLGTFVGNAIGAKNYKVAGQYLQIAYYVATLIAIPVIILWCFTGPVLKFFGIEEQLANASWNYALLLMAALPARIIFRNTSAFFNAQKITKPSLQASIFGITINLIFGYIFVFGNPEGSLGLPAFEGYGFYACPIVTVTVEYVMTSVMSYKLKTHPFENDIWPDAGWSMKNIESDKVKEYLKQYVPMAASIASDFWRVAAIGVVCTVIGENELAAFNISYRILWMTLTFVGSVGGAMGIKISQAFGAGDAQLAKKRTTTGLNIIACLLVCGALIIIFFSKQLGSIFSDDETIIEIFGKINFPFANMMIWMNLAVANEIILGSMGRSSLVFYIGLVGSWVGQVPCVIIAVYINPSIISLYYGVSAGYFIQCMLQLYFINSSDWDLYCKEAQKRAGKKEELLDEKEKLTEMTETSKGGSSDDFKKQSNAIN